MQRPISFYFSVYSVAMVILSILPLAVKPALAVWIERVFLSFGAVDVGNGGGDGLY